MVFTVVFKAGVAARQSEGPFYAKAGGINDTTGRGFRSSIDPSLFGMGLTSMNCARACPRTLETIHLKGITFMKTLSNQPQEWKLVSLRECPTPEEMQICEGPEQAAKYWETHVTSHPHFDPDRECLVVLLLNTRRKIKGHHLVSIGTLDTILVSASSVFRVAVLAAASAIVIMHNHPSGEQQPSEADIRVTRDLIRAGQLLKIEVCDHVIMGCQGRHASLKALGYFSF